MRPAFQLPRGFYDFVGPRATTRLEIADWFRLNALQHGFELAILSPVGYEDLFLEFGSAARDRGYQFTDPGGRKLMLAACSLAPCLRAYGSHGLNKLRIAAATGIFRHRKKRYRHWTHLVLTMINEKDSPATDITLIECANRFVVRYFESAWFEIIDFGIPESIMRHLQIDTAHGKEMLRNYYKDRSSVSIDSSFGRELSSLLEIAREWSSDPMKQLMVVEARMPYLAQRVAYFKHYISLLSAIGIRFRLRWDYSGATEYHSGIAFLVRDGSRARAVGDGGGYHEIASRLFPSIYSCISAAFSLDSIADRIDGTRTRLARPVCHAFRLDCSETFFLEACRSLREAGYAVVDVWQVGSLRRQIGDLPRVPHCSYAVIGANEQARGIVEVQESASKAVSQSVEVSLDKSETP